MLMILKFTPRVLYIFNSTAGNNVTFFVVGFCRFVGFLGQKSYKLNK